MALRKTAPRIPAVCLLYGKKGKEDLFDEYLAEEHLAAIKHALSRGGDTAVSQYEASEADLADVLDEVSTPALWGGGRLVIVREAEDILAPAAGKRPSLEPFVERMGAIAGSAKPAGHLVLIARGLDVKGPTPSTGFPAAAALIKAIAKAGGVFSCVPPYESELKAALARRAAAAGVKLEPEAVDALVSSVGAEQMACQEELDKLITGAGHDKRITFEDVEAVASARPHATVFSLADKILEGNTGKSLSDLRELRLTPATRSAAFILAGLASSFRRHLSAAYQVEKGYELEEAAAAAGVPAFVRERFAARLKRWNVESLLALLNRALQCDVETKTASADEETALELFIADACAQRLEKSELVGRWLYEI